MRRHAVACVVLLAVAPLARGDEPGLAHEKVAALRAAAERLPKEGTAEKAWKFEIAGFKSEDYARAADALPADLPDAARESLGRACRTAALRLGPLGRLEHARDACYLLASPRDEDWLKAFRLLRREPLGDDLDGAVLALAKDARPEVRLIASRLASSLVVFGRKDLVDVVLAALADPDPNVVGSCAVGDAMATGDKRVVDRMVAIIDDPRTIDPDASPFLNLGPAEKTLGDYVRRNLCWTFWTERRARHRWMPPLDALGHELSADETRAWWKENRESFGFGTPAPQWRCVFDDVLVVDVGERLTVHDCDGRPLKIDLSVYREHWLGGEPVTTISGEIHTDVGTEDQYVTTFGTPDRRDVSVCQSRGTWGDGTLFGEHATRVALLPTDRPGRVRMRLTMHIGHVAPFGR
ncbi:MAG TPA: HEAT repeat domain-containing protein [Planctomycetota bacterium]|nr:HEAT repeat domain-containing protein [Planctomycetota bacterium]